MITVMNLNLRSLLSLLLGIALFGTAVADKPSLLRMFGRAKSVEANSSKSYQLSEEDGPWMILASNFVGEGSKTRAERLAFEIRKELGLPAFIYQERFDFTGNINSDPRFIAMLKKVGLEK